ncbi:SDR family NAD(P)-dependent oxidoreductase [Nocardia sp. NPDC058518]|uniref:SDR family NAD(P)-dependent oxidoreductase n=1 Tax=Nocardia sp. NPDC058518 TaxID=3346534 RepID=UPI00365BCAC7
MSESLAGRVAVITGAAGGLGREYARLFAAEGARLVLADHGTSGTTPGDDPLAGLVGELRGAGAEVAAYLGDIGAEESADALVAVALERFGALDVLVNNAGNWYEGPIAQTPLGAWDSIMHVHLRGHFLTLRAAARHWMSVHESGQPAMACVINTTSRSALNAIAGHSVYAAAKGGIIALTHVAADELAPYGVRVNCVAPAGRTGMTLGITALADAIRVPCGAEIFDEWDPANVAPLIAYLATRDCPLTGEILFARGGTVQRYERWLPGRMIDKPARWTVAELAELVPLLVSGRAPE